MRHLQETHGVDILQDYTSQGIAVHILIWDLGIRLLGSSVLARAYFVSMGPRYYMWIDSVIA